MTTSHNKIEEKIEELYEKYHHLDNDMVHETVFPLALKQAMSWAIKQIIPKDKKELKDSMGRKLPNLKIKGYNDCIEEILSAKRDIGL